jgi:hypothetical protein
MNKAWQGVLAKAEPRTLRYRILHGVASTSRQIKIH